MVTNLINYFTNTACNLNPYLFDTQIKIGQCTCMKSLKMQKTIFRKMEKCAIYIKQPYIYFLIW